MLLLNLGVRRVHLGEGGRVLLVVWGVRGLVWVVPVLCLRRRKHRHSMSRLGLRQADGRDVAVQVEMVDTYTEVYDIPAKVRCGDDRLTTGCEAGDVLEVCADFCQHGYEYGGGRAEGRG